MMSSSAEAKPERVQLLYMIGKSLPRREGDLELQGGKGEG